MVLLSPSIKSLFLSSVLFYFCSGQIISDSTDILKGGRTMKRVTGIGGIFFKAKNTDALRAWYRQHLGIEIEAWGGFAFKWRSEKNSEGNGTTVWNIFKTDTKYFDPSQSTFMINYRVDNLDELLRVLRVEGCNVDSKVEESEFGKFGWLMDPEGNRIELWQPPPGQ
jgi:predicted enzyme related to lactoylglutathione lyase